MLSSIRRLRKNSSNAKQRPARGGKAGKLAAADSDAPSKKGNKRSKARKGKKFLVGAEGNFVNIDESAEIRLSSINISNGKENTIEVGKGVVLASANIVIRGTGNKVIFSEKSQFTGRILVKGNNQTVSLGRNSTTADVYMLCSEGCNIIVGDNCMFSRKIEIRTSDAHSLIDRETGNRLNLPQSIRIGNHVWVGVGVIINKGTEIPDDCIVGALSFVNKAFTEESVVLAGAPARIVKRNVSWNRTRKPKFRPREMDFWKTAKPSSAERTVPDSASE
jgi:acetyltransferase-like isoleucine patch superfamily enzyme